MAAVSGLIAKDISALRLGAEGPEPEVEENEYEDSSEEDEPIKPGAPPPLISRLYAVPRDYKRLVEVYAEVDGKQVQCRQAGPDYGENSDSKFLDGCKSINPTIDPTYFCVPYDGRKVLSINTKTGAVQEIGKTFKKEGGKYTQAVTSNTSHGRLYSAPCRAQRLLQIDSVSGQIEEVGPVLGSKRMNKWWAIATSCKGRIYAIPYDAPRVLEIDPNRSPVTARMVGPDLGDGKAKYCSIAEAPNGNLYCPPLNARQMLEISATGNVSLVGPNLGDKERKYACIIQAPNKLLYCPPLYADRVLEVNCARGDVREIGEIIGVGEAKYACCVVARQNGRVYCPPLEARQVLEIDPEMHDAHVIGLDLGGGETEKYSSICQAAEPSTKLYCAPREAHFFLEICPYRQYVRTVGNDHGRCPRKFSCIVPGAVWQGGMLREEYAAFAVKKEKEFVERMEKYQQRLARHRKHRAEEAMKHGYGGSKQVSRNHSKEKDSMTRQASTETEFSRQPSKEEMDLRKRMSESDPAQQPSRAGA